MTNQSINQEKNDRIIGRALDGFTALAVMAGGFGFYSEFGPAVAIPLTSALAISSLALSRILQKVFQSWQDFSNKPAAIVSATLLAAYCSFEIFGAHTGLHALDKMRSHPTVEQIEAQAQVAALKVEQNELKMQARNFGTTTEEKAAATTRLSQLAYELVVAEQKRSKGENRLFMVFHPVRVRDLAFERCRPLVHSGSPRPSYGWGYSQNTPNGDTRRPCRAKRRFWRA